MEKFTEFDRAIRDAAVVVAGIAKRDDRQDKIKELVGELTDRFADLDGVDEGIVRESLLKEFGKLVDARGAAQSRRDRGISPSNEQRRR